MRIDRVWYHRPGGVFRTQLGKDIRNLTPSARTRWFPNQITYGPNAAKLANLQMREYNTKCERSLNVTTLNDKVALPHRDFVISDQQMVNLDKNGAIKQLRRKVLGDSSNKPPVTRPVSSLSVRQMSPTPPDSARRSISVNSWFDTKYGSGKSNPKKIAIYKLDSGAKVNDSLASSKELKSVTFADNLPTMRSSDAITLNDGLLCWHQAMVPPEEARKMKHCVLCKGNRPEMVLPKIDLTSAINEGVMAAVQNSLTNPTSGAGPFFTPKERDLITRLQEQELDRRSPDRNRNAMRPAQVKKSTSMPSRRTVPPPATRSLLLDGPRQQQHKNIIDNSKASLVSVGCTMSLHGGSGDRRLLRNHMGMPRTGVKRSIELKTFQMYLPA